MEIPQEDSLLQRRKRIHVSSSKMFDELGILVLDGSGSMEEQTLQKISKAEAVTVAVNELFSRFKESKNRNNFSFAIVNYDHRAVVKMQPTPVKDIDDHGDYNPMDGLGGATYISEGLKEAKKIAEDFLSKSQAGGVKRTVVVLIMTDGVDMTQAETISMANTLKQMDNVKVAGSFFVTLGGDKDEMKKCEDYVKDLCTDETLYSTINSSEDLRKFFTASMSNMGL